MTDQMNEEFYRKFMGLQQCSKAPLTMVIGGDGYINISLPADNDDPVCTLTRKEFMEWPSYKILEVAGVPVV